MKSSPTIAAWPIACQNGSVETDFLRARFFDHGCTNRYEVFVTLSKAVDYGMVQLTWDAAKPQPPLDLYNEEVANPIAKKNFMFGFDYVLLVPREAQK